MQSLSDIVRALAAEHGWRAAPSTPARTAPGQDQSQLVFVGNWQDPCPRRLLLDADLEPVDIVTWQVIRIHAEASKLVAFPSYPTLMSAIRVSRATLARALAVLRLTRWLPLCAALRDPHGRFAGHVYALNDEPVPLGEVLEIDAGYIGFAEQAQTHRSAHVRDLARGVWQTIQKAAGAADSATLAPVRVGDQLANRLGEMLHLLGDRVQNLNAAPRVQDLNPVRSSSVSSRKTTTTPSADDAAGPSTVATGLVFPQALSLTDSQRRVLGLRLALLAAELRQDVLDEAAGRVVAKRATTDPVRCEFDYVARLCTRALEGEFVFTDAGERVRRNRRERDESEVRLRRARELSEAERLKTLAKHRQRTGESSGTEE